MVAVVLRRVAAPRDEVAGRQANLPDARLHVGDDAAHIAAFDEHADGHHARAVFPADVHGAAGEFEIRHLSERDVHSLGRVHEDVFQFVQLPFAAAETHDDPEVLLALPEFGCRFAAETGLDNVLNVGNVQSVARGAFAVDFNKRLRHLARAINERAGHARQAGDFAQHGLHVRPQHAAIRSVPGRCLRDERVWA